MKSSDNPAQTVATPSRRLGWVAVLSSSFSLTRLIVTLLLSTGVALLLSPIFVTSFVSVWARTVFVGLVLLLAFGIAGHWPLRWMPRWVAQVVAVVLAAPLATLIAYLWIVKGDVIAFMQHEGFISGFFSISGASLVVGLVLALGALFRERDAQARAQELAFALERSTLEKQALDARLRLLHAQIEPHFLFNTLANVQQLVESGSPRAAPVLQTLIDYLRAAVPPLNDEHATLGLEVNRVRAYLELMRMRMPDRLAYDIDLPTALADLRFPPMALLTLVENAVRHGVDPSETGGHIRVSARAQSGRVEVSVTDTGVGMRETAAPGTGLTNLRERLLAFYGREAQLTLDAPPPQGVKATISFAQP